MTEITPFRLEVELESTEAYIVPEKSYSPKPARTSIPPDDLPLFAPKPVISKLEKEFWVFHKANRHVFDLLVSLAREWRSKTKSKLGIAVLYERARWELGIKTTDDNFTLNNNHRAFYARLIMADRLDLAGLFNLRQQRVKSTIKPSEK